MDPPSLGAFFIIESRELLVYPHSILEVEWVYLLEKWKSAYCGAMDVRLEIAPILPNSVKGLMVIHRHILARSS